MSLGKQWHIGRWLGKFVVIMEAFRRRIYIIVAFTSNLGLTTKSDGVYKLVNLTQQLLSFDWFYLLRLFSKTQLNDFVLEYYTVLHNGFKMAEALTQTSYLFLLYFVLQCLDDLLN